MTRVSEDYAVIQLSPRRWAVIRRNYDAGHSKPIPVYSVNSPEFKSEDEALALARKRAENV